VSGLVLSVGAETIWGRLPASPGVVEGPETEGLKVKQIIIINIIII